jgi:hypothetical protein
MQPNNNVQTYKSSFLDSVSPVKSQQSFKGYNKIIRNANPGQKSFFYMVNYKTNDIFMPLN